VRDLSHHRAAEAELVDAERDRGQDERKEVIDRAEGDERSHDRLRVERRSQEEHDHGLEHAEPARHVAHEPRRLREQVRAEHGRHREVRGRRQERPQRQARAQPIGGGDGHLPHDQARLGKTQLEPADEDRRPANGRQNDVRDGQEHEYHPDRAQRVHGQRQRLRHVRRIDHEHDAADEREAEPEGERVEQEDRAHLRRGQAPRGVEPEPDRAARHDRNAERMAERIADERREGRLAVGKGPADVPARERVVERERAVAERRRREREQDPCARQLAEHADDVAVVDVAERVVERHERDGEEGDAGERRQVPQPIPEPSVRGAFDLHPPALSRARTA
jgi:hypothetical protein